MSSRTGRHPPLADGARVAAAERRFAQTEARAALSRAVCDSACFFQMATDERGVIQIFTAGAERMLGYDATDVVNRITPAEICDPQELGKRAKELSADLGRTIAPGFEALVVKAERGIEDTYQLTYVRKDGSRFPAMVSATALRDSHQRTVGYLLIGTSLRKLFTGPARADVGIARVLATMSHELRTPLNAVIGFSEALRDGILGELTESQKEYVGDIFTSGQRLLSLINDILDLSKVEAGTMSLDLEAVEVCEFMARALSTHRGQAAKRGISLDLELDGDLSTTDLDVHKTKQIVVNLVSNAVKFSDPGGRVTLRARYVPRSAVGTVEGTWPLRTVALADSEFTEFLEIRVTDGGIGIGEDNLARLFQTLTQIDSGPARRCEGAGLGLVVVRQMAEVLGGSVAVASKEGEGACFAAWVPLRTSAGSVPAGFMAEVHHAIA